MPKLKKCFPYVKGTQLCAEMLPNGAQRIVIEKNNKEIEGTALSKEKFFKNQADKKMEFDALCAWTSGVAEGGMGAIEDAVKEKNKIAMALKKALDKIK